MGMNDWHADILLELLILLVHDSKPPYIDTLLLVADPFYRLGSNPTGPESISSLYLVPR
jgi:hypothetical protein